MASSPQQLAGALNRDGLGAGFNGVFIIEDARHAGAGTIPPLARTQLSRIRTMATATAVPSRLAATASPESLMVQSALVAAGFARASFIAAGGTTR